MYDGKMEHFNTLFMEYSIQAVLYKAVYRNYRSLFYSIAVVCTE